MDTSLPACTAANIRYNGTSNNLYLTGPVTCTLTQLAQAVPATVLTRVAGQNATWLLRANLMISQGAMLALHGTAVGGDVDHLRLLSTPAQYVNVRATWGTVDMRNTHVTSWDEQANRPDTDSHDGRAYINVQSYLDGRTARQSRMNVIASEVSYLGFPAGESYGLTWKVSGTGISGDMSPVFDQVDVLGDIRNSHLHHNYYAAYTWGAYCMVIDRNEVDHNEGYGLDHHDNSDLLSITNNNVHDNGTHGIICSKNCDHLTIVNNRAWNNGRHGIMLHRYTDHSVVQGNSVYNNGESGIAVFDSHNNVIRGNNVWNNPYGIHVYVGSGRNLIELNQVHGNSRYGILFSTGTDLAWGGDSTPRGNVVEDNFIYSNVDTGLTAGNYAEQTIRENSLEPPPAGETGPAPVRRVPILDTAKVKTGRAVRPHP